MTKNRNIVKLNSFSPFVFSEEIIDFRRAIQNMAIPTVEAMANQELLVKTLVNSPRSVVGLKGVST